jgi:hypothetical protein
MNAHEPDPADIWWNQARGIPTQKATDPYRSPSPPPRKAQPVVLAPGAPLPPSIEPPRSTFGERAVMRAMVVLVLGLVKILLLAAH